MAQQIGLEELIRAKQHESFGLIDNGHRFTPQIDGPFEPQEKQEGAAPIAVTLVSSGQNGHAAKPFPTEGIKNATPIRKKQPEFRRAVLAEEGVGIGLWICRWPRQGNPRIPGPAAVLRSCRASLKHVFNRNQPSPNTDQGCFELNRKNCTAEGL